ncbi:MAG: hypothetical protein K2I96_25095 [Lachnospiraceae bacterium]|nr:hypothetical protein [Lachnospiraceae bacterium]
MGEAGGAEAEPPQNLPAAGRTSADGFAVKMERTKAGGRIVKSSGGWGCSYMVYSMAVILPFASRPCCRLIYPAFSSSHMAVRIASILSRLICDSPARV